MKPLSIGTKIWLAIGTAALAFVVSGGFLIAFLYEKLYVDEQLGQFMEEGSAIVSFYEKEGLSEELYERVEWANERSRAQFLLTDDPMELASGVPFAADEDAQLITFEERQSLLDGETVVIRREHPRFQQELLGIALPLISENKLEGAIFISMPLAVVYEAFVDIQWALYAAVLFAAFFVIVSGKRMTKHIVEPLREMKASAKEMENGHFSKRVAIGKSHDELAELAHSFNELAKSLEQVDRERNAFLANVAHELRTPLSYMIGYAEGIQEGVIERNKGMAVIEKEAKRLDRLVNDLLDLAQLEGNDYRLDKEAFPFAELAREAVATFAWQAEQKHIKLELELDEDSIIDADWDRMQQVLTNLLANAIAYSPPFTTVTVRIISSNGWAELVVEDEGAGIPEADLSSVQKRFYRVKKGRSRQDGGTGLGLAIVQEIVAKHGGDFQLVSQEGKGTTATVRVKEVDVGAFKEGEQT